MPILLDGHADAHPDRPALIDEDRTTTWSELRERVTKLCNALSDHGFGTGDTIVAMMGNRNEFFEVLLAAAHTGFTVVPVNWHWVADELAYVIEDSGATGVIVGSRFEPIAVEALADERAAAVDLVARGGGGVASVLRGVPARVARRNRSVNSSSAARCSTHRARPAAPRACGACCRAGRGSRRRCSP